MESELLTQYPELKRLARRIRRSEGEFSLFFVECNLPTLRYELANTLNEQLETPAVQVTLPALSEHLIQFDQLIAERIKDEPLDSSVFLFGLENWLPTLSKETLHQTVQQLNWRRSSFARLERPLVIWLPKYALDLLAEHTPDFYDWYSGVFVFKGEKQAQGLEIEESMRQLYHNDQITVAADHITQEETRRWLHTLKSLLHESQDSDSNHFWLLNEIALLYKKLGDLDKCQHYLEQSLSIAHDAGETLYEGSALNNISQVYKLRGRYDKALEYLERSLVIQQEIGDKKSECITLNNISQIHQENGDTDTALKYLDNALLLARASGGRAIEADIFNNISGVYYSISDCDAAIQYLDQALEIYKEVGNKSGESTSLYNQATIALAKRDYDISIRLLKKSLVITREIGEKLAESKVLSTLSDIFRAKDDFETAHMYLEQSLEIKQKIGDKFGEPNVLIMIGNLHWDKGDKEMAFSQWLAADVLAKEVGNSQVLKALEKITSLLDGDEMKDWEARAEKLKSESLPG